MVLCKWVIIKMLQTGVLQTHKAKAMSKTFETNTLKGKSLAAGMKQKIADAKSSSRTIFRINGPASVYRISANQSLTNQRPGNHPRLSGLVLC